MRNIKVILILIFVMFFLTTLHSAEKETRESLLAKIMMKIISFDQNIDRFGDPIKIGLTDDEMLKSLREMRETKIKGKKFVAIKIVLTEEIKDCNVVFVGRSMSNDLQVITKIAKEYKILTFGYSKCCLQNGIAVGLDIEDHLPVIWLNLVNAVECGSKISLDSLKLVVVKGTMMH